MGITAIVTLSDEANRIVNIVKAKYGLKDKSQALNKMIQEYEKEVLEPELRPEYIEKLNKIRKGKYTRYNSIADVRKAIG